jgi:O-antigen ligase
VGQLASLADSLTESTADGRALGLSTHPNFFGLCGIIASGLAIHLLHRVPGAWRWLVLLAGALCVYSVSASGSRAALIAVATLVLAYPFVERSAVGGYLILAGGVAVALVADQVLPLFGQESAVSRLVEGDETATGSNNQRVNALEVGWARFLDRPLVGNGFDIRALDAHNVYLQVAIGLGIVGAIAFVLLLWSTMSPLFGSHPLRRLGYASLGYAIVAVLTNSMWDRFVWIALALALLAHHPAGAGDHHRRDAESPQEAGAR